MKIANSRQLPKLMFESGKTVARKTTTYPHFNRGNETAPKTEIEEVKY